MRLPALIMAVAPAIRPHARLACGGDADGDASAAYAWLTPIGIERYCRIIAGRISAAILEPLTLLRLMISPPALIPAFA